MRVVAQHEINIGERLADPKEQRPNEGKRDARRSADAAARTPRAVEQPSANRRRTNAHAQKDLGRAMAHRSADATA